MKKFYNGLPVLVTGGCGFIGSHCAEKLVELGADVTIIDNCSTGRVENIASIRDTITFLKKDISYPHACLEATKGKILVLHHAAFTSVPQSLEQPSACHQSNVDGTFNILEASRLNGVQRFLFSSSAAVYGNRDDMCDEQTPCRPESPYGYSKSIGELYCKQYAKNFGLKTVILRYFNVWGDRQNPDGAYAAVVAKFRHQMRHNQPITIYGDGSQTRDFVPVRTIVDANLTLGMRVDTALSGQVFNIATNSSITLLDLVNELKKEFPHYTGTLLFAPERTGDLKHSYADCRKYQKICGLYQ